MTTDYRAMCAELADAAEQARQALEGWANYGKWLWPESALEQAKRNTTEALASLNRASALLDQPVAEGPTIPNSKLHRQELTPLEITLLIEALDFAIGDIKARPNSSNHVAVRAKLKRSISRPKATND